MGKLDGLPTTLEVEDVDLTKARDVAPFTAFIGPATWNWGGLLEGVKGATGLPTYGSKQRDAILRHSIQLDPMWRTAVYKAITKYVAMGYTVSDTSNNDRRLNYAKSIIQSFDGGNYSRGMKKGMRDFLTTNWGQIAYIDRPALGARVRGLFHLDSLRVTPYPHDDYPMLYQSPKRGPVLLRAENIIHISDMTDPDPAMYNLGHCAADAIWGDLLLMVAMQTYQREKVSGSRNLAIHFITGVNPENLEDALNNTSEAQRQRQFVIYRGSTIIPMLGGADTAPQLITIPLAEIPDGFEPAQISRDFYLRCANVVGVPVQEIQPLSGQGLGTGTQSLVLDDAARGQGLAAYGKEWPEQVSGRALPETSTYTITPDDLRDQKLKADVSKTRAETRALRIESGEISAQEARQLAYDDGDLPQELFAAEDRTAGGQLTDDQKPVVLAEVVESAPALPVPAPTAQKAARRLTRFAPDAVESVEGAARALLSEIRGQE